MIIDHESKAYHRLWKLAGESKYNGAYYYSKEIVKNIIPRIKTDRNWVTINAKGAACDHAIVFIHNNINPSLYDWLKDYRDLILVCGVPETCEKVKHLGTPIYLPLSVDVEEVKSYKLKKSERKGVCYAGRAQKLPSDFEETVEMLAGLPRPQLLKEMAKYKKVYAVGRTAIEAKILGCEILPYDPRFPDVDFWEILDNKDAAKILQEKLDEIDNSKKKITPSGIEYEEITLEDIISA